MDEIAQGIRYWSARHPRIGVEVSSYWLPDLGVALDPLAPPAEVAPREVLLTNRHHLRDAVKLHEIHGCTIRAPQPGMHEYERGEPVEPYGFGDELAGGAVVAYEVGAICPDEAALHMPSLKALAVADGVVHYGGELGFVRDSLMDEPERTKRELKRVYAQLADELDFDVLLTAHGPPIASGARERLREFASA